LSPFFTMKASEDHEAADRARFPAARHNAFTVQ
jgi:hypothetical protein